MHWITSLHNDLFKFFLRKIPVKTGCAVICRSNFLPVQRNFFKQLLPDHILDQFVIVLLRRNKISLGKPSFYAGKRIDHLLGQISAILFDTLVCHENLNHPRSIRRLVRQLTHLLHQIHIFGNTFLRLALHKLAEFIKNDYHSRVVIGFPTDPCKNFLVQRSNIGLNHWHKLTSGCQGWINFLKPPHRQFLFFLQFFYK